MQPSRFLRAGLAATLALTVAACGGDRADDTAKAQDANAPLAFVPADTPYVFGNLEPVPRAVTESWLRVLQPLDQAIRESLRRAREAAQRRDDEETRRLVSVLELFEDKLTLAGWESVGFDPESLMALYGVGVQPVIRFTLADAGRFRAFVAELERRIGQPAPLAQVDGLDYWRFPLGRKDAEQEGAIVVAIIGDHLVATLDLPPLGEPLPVLLGLQRPAQSLADGVLLSEVNRQYGFGNHGTFVLDAPRLLTALIGADENDSTLFTRLAQDGGKDEFPPECRGELHAIVQQWPRLVAGYTRLDASHQNSTAVLELESSLAQSLSAVTAPVPGLGSERDGIEFGLSLRLDKLAEFIQARASAIRAQPYTCELLQPLNESAEQVGQQMAGLYMAAAWFTGARLVINDLQFGADGAPSSAEGLFLLAAPNPAGLIAMAKGFVPQLAQLDLAPGGPPLRIDTSALGTPVEIEVPVWAAMSDTALGLGFGSQAQERLPGQLSGRPADPAPLLHVGYSGTAYRRFMEAVEKQTGEDFSGFGFPKALEEDASSEAAEVEYIFAPLAEATKAIYDAIGYAATDILLTPRGVEMNSVTTLR